jgi:RNA polymerase sigma-70 factor, ECF subfamily
MAVEVYFSLDSAASDCPVFHFDMSTTTPVNLETYREFLLSLARRQLGAWLRPKVSESDIVQSTLLQAHNNLDTFRGASDQELRSWLATILHNQCVNESQKYLANQKRDIRRERSDVSQHLVCNDPTASNALVSLETINRMLEAIKLLPEDEREIIELRHIEQLSLVEISQRLQISRHAAYRRWKSALKTLGGFLKDD